MNQQPLGTLGLMLLALLPGILSGDITTGNSSSTQHCGTGPNDNGPLENLRTYKVVPDVIDGLPRESICIIYEGNKRVLQGNKLSTTETLLQPAIKYNGKNGEWYTLMMVDPDIPLKEAPILAQYAHWLVVNIPANSLGDGDVLGEYTPAFAVGPHRYTFLIWKQTGKINMTPQPGFFFSAKKFAEEHDLKLKAANFMNCGTLVLVESL